MSLTADAVREIQNSAAHSSENLKSLQEVLDHTPDIGTRLLVMPNEVTIHDLEAYMDAPTRFRGTFSTQTPDDFVKYCIDTHTDQAEVCFINAECMTAKAYFDIGTPADPGHGDHAAKLSLAKTAAYKAILVATARSTEFTQKSITEWLEEWRHNIVCIDQDGNNIDNIAKAIASLRNLKIEQSVKSNHHDRDFGASRSLMEQIDAESDDTTPRSIRFRCTPYEGLGERDIYLRLNIITSHDKPTFKLQYIQQERVEEELATEFKELIQSKMESIPCLVGTFTKE